MPAFTPGTTIEKITRRFRKGGAVMEPLEQALASARDPKGQGKIIYTRLYEGRARRAAKQSERRYSFGGEWSLLDGVPISIKDIFDVAGEATTVGVPALAGGSPARRNSALVASLRSAGAIITGRTNMTQFALSCLGLNPDLGTPLSPWNRHEERIAGGSSSGAAASVADGMAIAAIGTDTGGSVRIPAAFCGLVGFKPSQARNDLTGCFAISSSLDSIGSLAPSVACCATIDQVLNGPPPQVDGSPGGLHIAIAGSFLTDGLDPVVADAFDEAIRRIERTGLRFKEAPVSIGSLMQRIGQLGGLSTVEGWKAHSRLFTHYRGRCDPRVINRYLSAASVGDEDYREMLMLRGEIMRWANHGAEWDILIYPTSPILPPRLAELSTDEDYFAANARIYRNAGLANLADCCAISIPCHDQGAPPVAVTLMARRNHDGLLLSFARRVEKALREE